MIIPHRALEMGARVAAISLAERGAYVAWKDDSLSIKPVARNLEGLRGAGDTFAGGFATATMLGSSPATSARLGTVAAGLKVERPGPLLGPPFREDVRARTIELGWTDATDVIDSIEALPIP